MRKGSILLAAIALVVLLPGCGDDPPPNKPPEPPAHLRGGGGGDDPMAAFGGGPTKEDDTVPVPSEKWDRIRTHVERFVTNPVYARTNPFRNKLAEILQPPPTQPPVEVIPTATDDNTTPVVQPEVDLHPLQQFALNELRLVMIMHGIAQPEAVFVDPLGQPWIVRTGTPIGNKRGQKIRSIKQYKVYVDEPDSEEDTPVGIAPAILTRTFEGDRDPQEDPAFYAEPLTQMPIKNTK